MTPHLINIIPNTLIDDFFFFGFLGGIIGYASYLLKVSKDKHQDKVEWITGIYGVFLSGCVGGLLAIVFDKAIEVSILVGLLNQVIYLALIKSAKNDRIWQALKEVAVKVLLTDKRL